MALAEGSEVKERNAIKSLTDDDVTEVYRKIAAHAAVVSGTVSTGPNGNTNYVQNIRTFWSQRDIDRKEKTRFSKTHMVQVDTRTSVGPVHSYIGCTLPQEVTNILWDVESPSEKQRVVVLKVKDKKGDEKQFVEIWNENHKIKTIDVKALDKHGDIVGSDGQFGSLQWSECEEYILYVAEKKKPKTSSFFDDKPASDADKAKGENADIAIKGGEYLYQESWGEQLVERHHTIICKLNIKSGVVSLLDQVPDEYSPGQALWGPEGEVVFVGWLQEPYRLGLKFCVERTSFLFKATFDGGDCEKLSGEGRAVRCPSFSPDFSRLTYLDIPEGGAHNQCSRLMMIHWQKQAVNQETSKVIVDMVNSPYKTGYDPDKKEFPGLFIWADLGTQRNWLQDNVHVLLTSYCRSVSTVFIINTDTGDVRSLCPGDISWACTLLDVRGYDVLLSCSLPDQPPFLMFSRLKLNNVQDSQWLQLGSDQGDESPASKSFTWQVLEFDPKTLQSIHPHYVDPASLHSVHPDYDYLKFEAILYLPTKSGDRKPPLVLFPHGGPHSSYDSNYMLIPAVFASCGFAILCVNFRGSLGFGQDSIQSLLGHIGDFDVKDCLLAMETVRKEKLVDPQNTFVFGGSHGGFLSAHLIGQYPKEFRAASMRNPVTNLTSMTGTTDIPDWVFTEAGLTFSHKSLAKGDLLSKLWEASPVSYIDNVVTPVMLNIGLKDKRVPPSQGLEYYKMLKARGIPVKCLTYPESNHSLSEVDVEADSLVNSILWFAQHISD